MGLAPCGGEPCHICCYIIKSIEAQWW